MTKRLAMLLIGLSIAAGAACGRKGPLELPPGRAPQPVERLAAVPAGGSVVLTWTNPVKTVAGTPLGRLGAVEVWVFEKDLPAAGSVPAPGAVRSRARLARRLEAAEAAAASYTFRPVAEGPTRLAFAVRVIDRKGRASEFSPVAVADVVRPPSAAILPQGEAS